MIWQSHIFSSSMRRKAKIRLLTRWGQNRDCVLAGVCRAATGCPVQGPRVPVPNGFAWFRALAWCVLAWPCAAGAATVAGHVTLVSSHDPNVRKHTDYSGVVVWLEPAYGTPLLPASAGRAQMVQKNKTFSPHVLPITVGTVVDFPNFDPIFHNAFSNYNGQVFDIGLYAPGTTRKLAFRREGVVRVFCNIHPSMSAVIVVLKSPYFTTSGRDGAFQIATVPAGAYRLHVFHERATEQMLTALTRTIDVGDGSLQLPPIEVSESGYLELPHKNKFGKDYPPVTDTGAYAGAKP
jgi:plastocyanin